jgi:stage II sporulation protein D
MRRLLMMGVAFMVVVLLILPTMMGRLFGRSAPAAPSVEGGDSLPIAVYFPQSKQVKEMPLGEYLKGVVAAEMPPEFAGEALKAQFVVARTYAVGRMKRFTGKGGCPLHAEADICADYKTGQDYITREAAALRFGKVTAEALWKRLDQVQAETEGLVISYRGELIDPLYHSVSGTTTEDSGDYFTESLPYLKPVDDSWGKDSPKLHETKRFKPQELAEALSSNENAVSVPVVANLAKAGKAPVDIVARTATGRVKRVRIGGITMTGREFREQLGLRSNDFTVKAEQGEIIIQTRGYGHGVGMSQYGAQGMALAGKPFLEILKHYYQGVTVARMFEE